MIVSPRAAEVTDILRKEGDKFIEVDEVFLYHRIGIGAPYRKTLYWKRHKDAGTPYDQQSANSGAGDAKSGE